MQLTFTGLSPKAPLTIMNTFMKKYRDEEGKYAECLTLIVKDTSTGIKYKQEYNNPKYEFYTVHPDHRVRYNRLYVAKNICDAHVVPRIYLDREVADSLGMKQWYKDCIKSGDRQKIRTIHKHPDVFMSDNNIEDHYRFWFDNQYSNDICAITKAFFDIEVDGIEIAGQFPEPGECPVNAITVFFQERKEIYTFLLRSKGNLAQIYDIEKRFMNGGIAEAKQFILDHVSEKNRLKDGSPFYFGLEDLKLNILFYDEEKEIEMISDFFGIVNQIKPDFCLAWNQAFDIPYLIARIQELGYTPEEIICHPDFEEKECYYFIDERNRNEYEERCDYFACSSYTVWLDQMIQFASRRKGQTKFLNYKLDYIGEIMANVRKLDYKNITDKIEELPYKDYWTFVLYNICDTISQYCIEYYTQDIEYVFGKVIMNNTRYSKVHRQTVYLTNRGQKVLWQNGYVRGNNPNLDNQKIPYPGAFVADPMKVDNYSRMKINGTPTNIFPNLFDSDFKSLYPSIIRAFNAFAHTQIGFIMINEMIHKKENRTHYEYYTRGGQFSEDLQSHQWIEFAERWFGLLGFREMVEFVKYLYTVEIKPSRPMEGITYRNDNGYKIPIVTSGEYYFPIVKRENKQGYRRPFEVYQEMPEEVKAEMKEWLKDVAVKPNQSF